MEAAPAPTQQDACRYTINFDPSTSQNAQQLLSRCAEILALVAQLSQDYIWHKQPFNLSLSPISFSSTSSSAQSQHLHGETDVTDAVDDEWFIVWLLTRISQEYKDAVISIDDNDGEFLLIEAADVLPRWITPNNAPNRVWLHNSHLHLVPLEHVSALPFSGDSAQMEGDDLSSDETGFIDRLTAIQLVRDDAVDTRASLDIEKTVFARLSGYPEKIRQHLHHSLVYLPKDVALALDDSPELVSEAVAAFYERDPAALKACNKMTRFPPASPTSASTEAQDSPEELLPDPVFTSVKLTRGLYSQLALQRFFAPKPFERAKWMEAGTTDKETDERRRELGMKLACGFEILYTRTKPFPRTSSSADMVPPGQAAAYEHFLRTLEARSYFPAGEQRGSQAWNERERIARRRWLSAATATTTSSTHTDAQVGGLDEGVRFGNKGFAQRVDEAAAQARASGALARRLRDGTIGQDDDTAWMAMDEQGLEEMLASRGPRGGDAVDDEDYLEDSDLDEDEDENDGMEGIGKSEKKAANRTARKVARELETMAGRVEDFVHGRGALEGAEFDDERSEDDDELDSDEEQMPQMTAEERAARLEKLVAPLHIEEWGQKEKKDVDRGDEENNDSYGKNAGEAKAELPSLARPSRLTENKYDGASSDDSSDEDMDMPEDERVQRSEGGLAARVNGIAVDEDDPSVVERDGDEEEQAEMDMQEEMDEFLKFATETLGLTEEQYGKILGERKERGAFVPGPAKPKKTNVVPTKSTEAAAVKTTERAPAPKPVVPQPPLRNPNLTDFDALMEQMDAELAKIKTNASQAGPRASAGSTAASSKPVKKAVVSAPPSGTSRIVVESDDDDDDDDEPLPDDLVAMDAELAALFKTVNGDDPNSSEPVDYNLVKNFLESFQSQGGFGGPAGNLAGRMGFTLPRDA